MAEFGVPEALLKTMKILHTEWSDGFGGQERRVLAEARGLSRRGHHLAIACRQNSWIRGEAEKEGLETYVLPMRSQFDLPSMLRLRRILKQNRFEIVNTHSGVDSWIGGIAAKLAGVPGLVRTRHLDIPLRRNMLNFVHYLPDRYITCGEAMRRTLVRDCGFPEHRVVSIPTGVDERFFQIERHAGRKREFGIAPGSPMVANIGILRKVKGHEILLAAVPGILKSFPDVCFLLVGDGPRRAALEAKAAELGISGHVRFTGFIDDVSGILSCADVVVNSSWSEGLPQSVLQALAAGVPVVATAVGGVPEVVRDGDTGILVPPGDHDALATGVSRMLARPSDLADVLRRGRELVTERFSLAGMLNQTERLYRDVLEHTGSSIRR